MKATLGWDCMPTTTRDGIHVLPRKAEDLLNQEYYPNGSGTWPIDPVIKQKLEADMNSVFPAPTKTDVKATTPWYLTDKHGYPIEFIQGKGRVLRIICQNIRKIAG